MMIARIKDNKKLIRNCIYICLLIILTKVMFNISKSKLITIFSIAALIAIFLVFILTSMLDEISIQKRFIIILLLYGSISVFIFPFRNPLDERAHFQRAFSLSNGTFFLQKDSKNNFGAYLPQNIDALPLKVPLNKLIKSSYNDNISPNNKFISDELKYTNPYLFTSYIPMAIGIKVARIFSNKLIYATYLGRLFNLLAYSLLMYFAVDLIPIKKVTLCIIALVPMQFILSCSYSLDGIVLGSIALFVSYILNLRMKKNITIKQSVLLLVMASMVITCKSISYIPLLLLFFLLKKCQFKNNKHYFITLSVGVIISVVYIFMTLKLTMNGITDTRAEIGTNSSLQLLYIMHHPVRTGMILLNTLYVGVFLNMSTSSFMSNLTNTFLYDISMFTDFLIITVCILDNKDLSDLKLRLFDKLIVIASALLNVILIMVPLYLAFTPVGKNVINGIQGRYFLPIVLVLLVLLFKFNVKNNIRDFDKRIITFQSFLMAYTSIFVIFKYYI